jgi:membrane associated rhomboid family serine protease
VSALDENGRPYATYAILAALALVFVGELAFGVRPWHDAFAPDVATLVTLGGLMRPFVEEGEWYRLLTASLLHGDVFHLALNGVALYMAGVVLEGLLGRAWLLALFVIGALSGSALALAVNPPNVVSVGASGAIMGLLAAALVSSQRLPFGAVRTLIQMNVMQVLIPSLIPLAIRRSGGTIDFAAHLGGAIAGALCGVFLLRTWPRREARPRFGRVALAIALAGGVALVVGLVLVATRYTEYAYLYQMPS